MGILRQLRLIQFGGTPSGSRHFVASANLELRRLSRLAPRDFPSGEKLRTSLLMTRSFRMAQTFHLSRVVGCATLLQSGRNTCCQWIGRRPI